VIREEWEALRIHDVIFLVAIENPTSQAGAKLHEFESERVEMAKGQKPHKRRDFQWAEEPLDFPSRYGVKYVRGAEVFEYRDEDGVLLNDPTKPDERVNRRGAKRKLRVRLDPAQYYSDKKVL